MRISIISAIWVLAGRGGVKSMQVDASVPSTSSVCDATGTFDAPMRLTEFNSASAPKTPRLTADELELYFDDHTGTADVNIYRAQRRAVDQPFGMPVA